MRGHGSPKTRLRLRPSSALRSHASALSVSTVGRVLNRE
jgi:hypothetical protein